MFVSWHPTVPKNGPDPSKTFFFILQKSPKNHPKITVFTNFNHFFLQTGFSSDFVNKMSFVKKKKKKKPSYLP